MKICFLLPAFNMSGGTKVVTIHARFLADKGHEVLIVAPPNKKQPFHRNLKSFLSGKGWPQVNADYSYFRGLGLNVHELETYRPIVDKDLPDADVVVATWWETAEWANALCPSKGAKVYFIQGYEQFDFVPSGRCDATYRLSLHKVVVAKWLLDLMRIKFGDSHVDLVPNSVDKTQFYGVERGKQTHPTLGFLFSYTHLKGVDILLQVIKKLKESIPDLRVVSFGTNMPNDFPMWDNAIEFYCSPAQEKISSLYVQCDVWITASRSEGFNLTAIEAMACRTPVVSTKTGWPEEALINGYNGFLTEIDDVDGLVDAAKTLLLESDVVWKKYSQNAYNTIENSSWQASADLFEKALYRACSRTKNGEIGNH